MQESMTATIPVLAKNCWRLLIKKQVKNVMLGKKEEKGVVKLTKVGIK